MSQQHKWHEIIQYAKGTSGDEEMFKSEKSRMYVALAIILKVSRRELVSR